MLVEPACIVSHPVSDSRVSPCRARARLSGVKPGRAVSCCRRAEHILGNTGRGDQALHKEATIERTYEGHRESLTDGFGLTWEAGVGNGKAEWRMDRQGWWQVQFIHGPGTVPLWKHVSRSHARKEPESWEGVGWGLEGWPQECGSSGTGHSLLPPASA